MSNSNESWTSSLINEQLRKRFESHDSAKVTNLAGQSCIASFMPPKKVITFEGLAGDNFAGMNNGSKIILNGDAKRFLGIGMHDGEIILKFRIPKAIFFLQKSNRSMVRHGLPIVVKELSWQVSQ